MKRDPGRDALFTDHQGNTEHRRGVTEVVDEISPRRPDDPWWRSRTAHRTSTPAATRALKEARNRHRWTITRAAQETGVSRPMISLLEHGLRRPSCSVAEALIDGLDMTADEGDAIRSVALEHVGRDSPYRTGELPHPDPSPRPSAMSTERQGNIGLDSTPAAGQGLARTDTAPAAPGQPASVAERFVRPETPVATGWAGVQQSPFVDP